MVSDTWCRDGAQLCLYTDCANNNNNNNTRNTFNRLFTKDGYTWNITHTTESTTV